MILTLLGIIILTWYIIYTFYLDFRYELMPIIYHTIIKKMFYKIRGVYNEHKN